ncbi:MAG: site-specific integrase [Chitinophagales bacterium]
MGEIMKYVRYYIEKRSSWKNQSAQRPRAVSLLFSYNGNRLHTLTGIKVAVCDWDEKKQRVKLDVKRAIEVNKYLDLLEEKVNDIYFGALAKGIIPNNNYILKEMGKDKKEEKPSFFEEWKKYLEIRKNNLKPGSRTALRISYEHFEKFAKGKRIDFEDVNSELVSKYVSYLTGLGHADNTIHKNIKRMRAFMTYAKKAGLHNNERYRDFNVSEKVGRITFLDWREVKVLLDYKAETPIEQMVLDNFLFGATTAMRFSDYHELKKSDVTQVNFAGIPEVYHAANVRQLKTDKITVVPLLPEALAIIKRNEDEEYAVPRLRKDIVNRLIKDIAKKAGINSKVPVDTYKGGKRETVYHEKWKLLSTHIGRKTFISVAAAKGIPIHIVAAIAGHNVKTCMKFYAGVADKDCFVQVVSEMGFEPTAKNEVTEAEVGV